MIPVLAVENPEAAARHFQQVLGLSAGGTDLVSFGDQQIRLCPTGAPPPGLIPMRLDHVALRIGDADACRQQIEARGGRLSVAFTPDGPAEIGAFWDRGVRYVFFDGPEGWPVEFCARIGVPDVAEGHDHLAIRTPDLDGIEATLAGLGARRVARHLLESGPVPVEVRFLSIGATTFELFDEAPIAPKSENRGWIGFLPG